MHAVIARGGRLFVLVCAAAAAAAYLADYRITIGLGAFAVFLGVMFRDPPREIGRAIVAPADGTVREVDPAKGLVSTYLALRNVHVTRCPVECTVTSVTRTEGPHSPAYANDSHVNERVELVLRSALGDFRLVEMTGAIARRIVPYVRGGERMSKGQRLSLIRFGSRVDLYLPGPARIVVAKGQRMRAGQTVVAEVDDAHLR